MDWANPTDDMVRQWAYTDDAMEPMQDWHLMIWGLVDPNLLVELASDPQCPTRDYFLYCLYGRVGDEVRAQEFDPATWNVVEVSTQSVHPPIALWATRSQALRSRPHLFDYEDWCGGGLARTTDQWPAV